MRTLPRPYVGLLAAGFAATVIGVWWLATGPPGPDPPSAAGAQTQPAASPEPAAKAVLHPPDDLDRAHTVAVTFADGLATGDLPAARAHATARVREVILAGQPRAAPVTNQVDVDGTVTRDLQPDHVLLDVVFRQPDTDDRATLLTITVRLIRQDGSWLVDDMAL